VLDPKSRDRPVIGAGVPYEREMVPWAISAWPADTDRVAVGMLATVDMNGYLALFSVADQRFSGGSVYLDPGVVRALDADSSGRIFAVMGWSGVLVRVTPR